MFQSLEKAAPDQIIGLIAAFNRDQRQQKIDLGVGVYQDESGQTPIMRAVKEAENILLETETTKSYQGMAGDPVFNQYIMQLVLGQSLSDSLSVRARAIHTPGGSGALRIAAEVIVRAGGGASVWVSSPTWVNHTPLIGGVGLTLREYPYYDAERNQLDFEAMLGVLSQVPAGDVVLLHGSCHNPSGADLNREQWLALTELAQQNGFIPLVDLAYQGLGDGLDEDAYGVRLMADQLPEMIIAVSCSKNFGLYRERAGAALFIAENAEQVDNVASQAMTSARRLYSMPPAHGAAIVRTIFDEPRLTQLWQRELQEVRTRIQSIRSQLEKRLVECGAAGDYSFIASQKGMFSFLGITPEQVKKLRDDSAIYMIDSSRVNLAGVNRNNIEYLVSAICALD